MHVADGDCPKNYSRAQLAWRYVAARLRTCQSVRSGGQSDTLFEFENESRGGWISYGLITR